MQLRWLLCAALLFSQQLSAITGGQPVAQGEAPWMVALADLSRPDDAVCTDSGGSELFCKQFCGATLIAPQWLLTAAHCLDTVPSLAQLRALINTSDLNDAAPRVLEVHSKYVPVTYSGLSNDIALLKLRQPVTDITPMSLVTPDSKAWLESQAAALNDPVSVYGWGRLSSAGAFPSLLQRVALDLLSGSACAAVYNTADIIQYKDTLMLCVAELTSGAIEKDDIGDVTPLDPQGEDACSYDSGGPLLVQHAGMRQLTGVVSFGGKATCGRSDRPAVYTRILPQLNWIEQQTGMGDLGLSLSMPSHSSSKVVSVQLKLTNKSVRSLSVNNPKVEIQMNNATPSALSASSNLNCVFGPEADSYICTYNGAMASGAEATMNWQITLPSSNAQASVSAQLVASGYQDYRAGNNTVEKTVTVSSLADVWLLNHGVSTEKAADAVAGDAWLFLAYGNASTLQNSSNLTLRISHNGDYQLLDDAGLNCTSSGSDYLCSLTGLTTSSSYERRLKLHSPAAQSGTITASLVSPSGFPLDRIAGSAAVNFYQPAGGDTGEIPRDPDPDPGTDPGAGPEVPEGTPMDTGSAAFFLFFLPLLLCRRR